MGKKTDIQWTDATWNPWRGCKKVSAGCAKCYMYREQKRYGRDPMNIIRAANATFTLPMRMKEPAFVFTCSWSDFFIREADEWRDEAWSIIRNTPHLTYQVLTKRPELVLSRLPNDWGHGYRNVWLGVSVENQEFLDRARIMADIPARKHFISYEPALGPVDFSPVLSSFDWLISGGESGPECRSAESDWFRSVRDQCHLYNVAYFHKQNGGTKRLADGAYGGRMLDGKIHEERPQ